MISGMGKKSKAKEIQRDDHKKHNSEKGFITEMEPFFLIYD